MSWTTTGTVFCSIITSAKYIHANARPGALLGLLFTFTLIFWAGWDNYFVTAGMLHGRPGRGEQKLPPMWGESWEFLVNCSRKSGRADWNINNAEWDQHGYQATLTLQHNENNDAEFLTTHNTTTIKYFIRFNCQTGIHAAQPRLAQPSQPSPDGCDEKTREAAEVRLAASAAVWGPGAGWAGLGWAGLTSTDCLMTLWTIKNSWEHLKAICWTDWVGSQTICTARAPLSGANNITV